MEDQNLHERETSQESNFKGVDVSTEKNLPHGINSNVPTRTGISENGGEEHPTSPTDDLMTSLRRARYGEDPAFNFKSGEGLDTIAWDVNQVLSRTNLTRDQVLNSPNGLIMGSGRHMCQ